MSARDRVFIVLLISSGITVLSLAALGGPPPLHFYQRATRVVRVKTVVPDNGGEIFTAHSLRLRPLVKRDV